jgi:hypothetical protein
MLAAELHRLVRACLSILLSNRSSAPPGRFHSVGPATVVSRAQANSILSTYVPISFTDASRLRTPLKKDNHCYAYTDRDGNSDARLKSLRPACIGIRPHITRSTVDSSDANQLTSKGAFMH